MCRCPVPTFFSSFLSHHPLSWTKQNFLSLGSAFEPSLAPWLDHVCFLTVCLPFKIVCAVRGGASVWWAPVSPGTTLISVCWTNTREWMKQVKRLPVLGLAPLCLKRSMWPHLAASPGNDCGMTTWKHRGICGKCLVGFKNSHLSSTSILVLTWTSGGRENILLCVLTGERWWFL